MSSINQVWKSNWDLFTKVCKDTITLLVKALHAHTLMKVIGGKTTAKTSATSEEEDDEDEQFDLSSIFCQQVSSIFCQQVWQYILARWGVSLDKETLE